MTDQNSQFFAILTAIGKAKQANADALGIPWTFAQMGVGDANDTDPIPNEQQTQLINERRRAPLNQLKVDPSNPNIIIAEQVIPENVGGWWIREVGLYDAAGDLVAVANCAPSFKPLLTQGSGRTQVVRMNLIVANTANVELKIDPSVVLATRQYVDSKILEELYKLDSKQSVRVATIANIALAGLQTIDGVTLVAGDRVLVKNQSAAKDNGVWVADPQAWKRAPDADSNAEVTSAFKVSVEQGVTQADTRWQLLTDGTIVVGTTPLNFQNVNQGLAPISSPAFTNIPTAPTAPVGTNTNQLATTAFTQAALAALVDSSPGALDTLNELAAALGDDPNFATTVTNALATKAPLNNPVFTGDARAPTPPAGDIDNSIATTAFVQQALSGSSVISVAGSGNIVVTAAQLGAGLIVLTGALTGNKVLIVPTALGRYQIWNATTGNFTLTVKTAAGTGVVVTQGQSSLLFSDGANIYLQQSDFINPILRGTPRATKAPRFDVSDQIMTAEAVQSRGVQYSGLYSLSGAVPGSPLHIGAIVHFTGAGTNSYSLPDATGLPSGSVIRLHNWGISAMAVAVQGADKIQESNDVLATPANRSIPPDTYVDCIYVGSNIWMMTGTGVAGKTRQFGALLAPNGYQRHPSGLLEQWMTASFASAFKAVVFNLPTAFPNQFFGCTVSLTDSAIYDSNGQPFVAGMPNGLGQVLLQSNYTASQSAVRVHAFGF
ncbi:MULTISPECIES: phage tail protein [unclassified Pseudomonas]|uniref:phage tail protein n=1 Tax=Pseudomonas sp. SHC52 TaxID=984195 RepID=UPI000538D5B4|nr:MULTISPECIES: phage tail protein [unclassified Pseudomonas]CDF94171.1 Phage tail fiber protein [Pseudomonas sp. SHC52]